MILIFKYRIAPILKLTYKFSIHLIFDSLLLSKCTYKEWITETVCSEIKFIFQICQFKCSPGPVFWAPNKCSQDAPTPPVTHLARVQPGTWEDEFLVSKPWNMWPLHRRPVPMAQLLSTNYECSWVLRSLRFACNSLARRSRITDPFPRYLVALRLISSTATFLANRCLASQYICETTFVFCIIKNCETAQWGSTSHLLGWLLLGRQEVSVGGDLEKRTPLCTIGGIINEYSRCGKQCGGSPKNEDRTAIWLSNPP